MRRAIPYRRGIGTYSRNLLQHFADAGHRGRGLLPGRGEAHHPSGRLVHAGLGQHGARLRPPAARARSGRWSKSPRSICCTCPAPGRPRRARCRWYRPCTTSRPFLYPAQPAARACACATSGSCTTTLEEVAPGHHRLADPLLGPQHLRRRRPGQGQGHPQRGLRAVRAPDRRPAVLLAVRHRYSLPERFVFWVGDFRPEKNLSFLIQAWSQAAETPGRPADPGAGRGAEGRLPQAAGRGRASAGLEGKRPVLRVHRRRRPAGRLLGGHRLRVPVAGTRASGCRLSRPWPAARPAWSRTPRRCPRSPAPPRCSSTPPRSTASKTAWSGCSPSPTCTRTLREAGLRQAARFPWKRAAEETLQVYRERVSDGDERSPA